MTRLACRLLFAAAMLLLLPGCWDRHELNDLSIVSTMGFDKKGDKILVTIQVLDPNEVARATGTASGSAPVVAYEAEGVTVDDAIGRLSVKAPYPLYLSHVRMVVVGEKLAREDGIGKVMDFISRDRQMRTDFYIILARKTTANNVLSIFTAINKIPGNKMFSALETSSKEWAPVTGMHLVQLIDDLVTGGKQLVLTGIRIDGDPDKGATQQNIENISDLARLSYTSLGVFRGDKLVGWLNENESKGYKYIRNEVVRTVGFVQCGPKQYTSFRIIRADTKSKVKFVKDKPEIHLNVRIEADVNEQTCGLDLNKEESLVKLSELASYKVVMIVKDTIKRGQQFHSDIFGFGELVERKAPRYWKQHREEWTDLFEQLEPVIHVDWNIRRVGTKSRSFLQEQEE
ncbi:spore germination protein KC [Paenibacillus phyllosphaerae]|uniref:Spore germination protein KC n=1 Tax=Paenibacillus phyllosphaerae TaxID=274593 RepID=A0A7W5AXT4_9BACL|nr:Ger(x)C family spore germination protein [Paenibacillus phyllosphaerae]MBB3110748.1 spore germination protein KC [Paenibacillus phyllosphaerae]